MLQKIKMMRLDIEHLETLRRVAEESRPMEACALLLGRVKGVTVEVTDIRITENMDDSPLRFTVDPETLYNILNRAEREGKAFVGVFHSHPAPASPSNIDLKYMVFNPIVWLIMSTVDGCVKAYQWCDDSIQTVGVECL